MRSTSVLTLYAAEISFHKAYSVAEVVWVHDELHPFRVCEAKPGFTDLLTGRPGCLCLPAPLLPSTLMDCTVWRISSFLYHIVCQS